MTMSSITTCEYHLILAAVIIQLNVWYQSLITFIGAYRRIKKKKNKVLGTLIDKICFRLLMQTSKYLLRNQSGR